MSDDPVEKPPAPPLSDDQITTTPGLGRRRFLLLGAVGGTAALGGCAPAAQSGITDRDNGPGADPVNFGRGPSGLTDTDTGIYADAAGYGRYGRPMRRVSGITDSDIGPGADPIGDGGRGRPNRGCTDSDVGPAFTDPIGRGRRC